MKKTNSARRQAIINAKQPIDKSDIQFSNSLIIHQVTNQSGYANLATCVRLETPMKHWTEAFPLYFDEISNPRA